MSEHTTETEREKYHRVWAWKKYRRQADGDAVVDIAFDSMGCAPGETLIDWGCGTGRPARTLAAKGLKVTGFDIAGNCLDGDVFIPLVVGNLWEPPAGLSADYGFCTDVLEHIPPEHVDTCIREIFERSDKAAFIQIDTELDISGPKMNPPTVLHLTVQPREWWHAAIAAHWPSVEATRGTYSRWAFLCRKS